MTRIRVFRRIVSALAAISIAGVLLRSQLSSALVTRGDSLAYWGQRREARVMYARAILFDAGNGVAVDRFAFDAATAGDERALLDCIRVSSTYLATAANDTAVLMDRALCYQRRRLLAFAVADFRRAGEVALDPRALMFAALDERALNRRDVARRLLREAVAIDPRFSPARRELARN